MSIEPTIALSAYRVLAILSVRRLVVAPRRKAVLVSLLLLAGCATFNKPVNVPVATGANPMGQFMPPDVGGDTASRSPSRAAERAPRPSRSASCAASIVCRRTAEKAIWIG